MLPGKTRRKNARKLKIVNSVMRAIMKQRRLEHKLGKKLDVTL